MGKGLIVFILFAALACVAFASEPSKTLSTNERFILHKLKHKLFRVKKFKFGLLKHKLHKIKKLKYGLFGFPKKRALHKIKKLGLFYPYGYGHSLGFGRGAGYPYGPGIYFGPRHGFGYGPGFRYRSSSFDLVRSYYKLNQYYMKKVTSVCLKYGCPNYKPFGRFGQFGTSFGPYPIHDVYGKVARRAMLAANRKYYLGLSSLRRKFFYRFGRPAPFGNFRAVPGPFSLGVISPGIGRRFRGPYATPYAGPLYGRSRGRAPVFNGPLFGRYRPGSPTLIRRIPRVAPVRVTPLPTISTGRSGLFRGFGPGAPGFTRRGVTPIRRIPVTRGPLRPVAPVAPVLPPVKPVVPRSGPVLRRGKYSIAKPMPPRKVMPKGPMISLGVIVNGKLVRRVSNNGSVKVRVPKGQRVTFEAFTFVRRAGAVVFRIPGYSPWVERTARYIYQGNRGNKLNYWMKPIWNKRFTIYVDAQRRNGKWYRIKCFIYLVY